MIGKVRAISVVEAEKCFLGTGYGRLPPPCACCVRDTCITECRQAAATARSRYCELKISGWMGRQLELSDQNPVVTASKNSNDFGVFIRFSKVSGTRYSGVTLEAIKLSNRQLAGRHVQH